MDKKNEKTSPPQTVKGELGGIEEVSEIPARTRTGNGNLAKIREMIRSAKFQKGRIDVTGLNQNTVGGYQAILHREGIQVSKVKTDGKVYLYFDKSNFKK
ncbi:MAG: hypothetical protein QXV17_11970 [Candidatus Micrarchaeaceae archaeon]